MTTTTTNIDFARPGDIESQPEIHSPAAAVQKRDGAPTAIELDQLTFGARYNGPSTPATPANQPGVSFAKDDNSFYNPYPTPTTEAQTPFTGAQTPASRGDLLASSPPTPIRNEAASLAHSFWYPHMNRYRVGAACLIYFCNGLVDSSAGAIIPYMEKQYDLGYASVSLIFVTQAIGFIVMAFVTDWLLSKLGRAKLLMISETILFLGSLMIVCNPPFQAVVFAYLLFGVGAAIDIALNNVFCANLANSSTILGIAHGSYGIGGILGPIIATTMISNGIPWSRYFSLTLSIRVLTIGLAGWSFWNYEREPAAHLFQALERTASRRNAMEAGHPTKLQSLWHSMKNRSTLIGALFIFCYQGAEVSISGWVISFLIAYRNGEPTRVGYVTTGFWVCLLNYASRLSSDKLTGRYYRWTLHAPSTVPPHFREEDGVRS